MKLRSMHQDEVPVLELAGRIDGAADNVQLMIAVKECARAGESEIVLDLRRVRMITSTGLGLLMRARNRLERDHGHLHLCELNPRNQHLLHVTQTRPLFEVYDSRDDAVQAAHTVH